MSPSEHALPMAPGGSPPPLAERPSRHAQRVGWWVRGALGLAVVVAQLAVIVLVRRAAHGPAATGWQTYHDPLGLFTVGVPPGWTAHGGQSGRVSFGGPAGSVSEVPEGVRVTNAAHGTGSGYVSIVAYYLPPAFVNGGSCYSFRPAAYGPLPGPPWRLTPYPGTWLVDTQNAHFQIESALPGVWGPLSISPAFPPPPPPPPVPASWVALDEPMVNAVLTSFRPAARPVSSCPG